MIPPLLVNATLREQPAPQKYDERVKLWQDLLKSRGYRSATTKSDGMFGPNTTAQTKALQKAKGLPQTGVADPVTIAVGHGQTPPKAQAPTPSSAVPPLNVNVASWRSVLKEGNKGQDVRELQQVLGKYGFVVAVDGDFGKGTTAATKLWQTTYARFPDGSGRVLTPDGQFGKNSRDRLLLLEQTPSTIAGTEELLSTAALSAMFAPQLMTFGAIPHLEAGILDELAAELVANLEATRVGEEDRDLVTRWQNANGIAATGNYGPTTAATLIPLGIVPPKPRHWPSKKLWRARSRYQVALREQARRDPARASEWLSAASNV